MLARVMRTSIPNCQRLCGSNGSSSNSSSSHTVLLRICVSHARPRHADLRFNLPPQSCQTAVKMWTAAAKRSAAMSHRLQSTRDRPPPPCNKLKSCLCSRLDGKTSLSVSLCVQLSALFLFLSLLLRFHAHLRHSWSLLVFVFFHCLMNINL